MASTYSSSLRIELPADGEQSGSWGQTINTNLGTLIESAIAGVESIALSGASDYTLSASNGADDESRHAVLVFTGGNSQARAIICPAVDKTYIISNGSNDTLTIKSSGGTDTVAVAAGAKTLVYSDGGEFYEVVNSTGLALSGGTMTGKLTLPASTTSAASANIPHGTAPTSPSNGDVWSTTAGLFVRINGSTKTVLDAATALLLAGGTMTGTIVGATPTSSISTIRLPHGTAPSSPTNGDTWTTTGGGFIRINGATVQFASNRTYVSDFITAKRTTDQTSGTIIAFDTVVTGGSLYSSGLFTVNTTGYYSVSGALILYNYGTAFTPVISIMVDEATAYTAVKHTLSTAVYVTVPLSLTIAVSAGQIISIVSDTAFNNSTGYVIGSGSTLSIERTK